MATNGQSCPFSADATGYVRGEGVGSVVLKPLKDALENNDHVYCVVRGSWLAHSGYSLSITMPSTDAQAELMKKTYQMFGYNMDNVDFVEAHGTGTPVGDPIEAEAIARAFTIGKDMKKPLNVGSSKSNFGHLECAAGMVQVVKAALMCEQRKIFPNINFGTPNPAIDMENWNITIPEDTIQYKENKKMAVGVNTFGFGGSLAHMIFEEYPNTNNKTEDGTAGWQFGNESLKGKKLMVPFSAKNAGALKGMIEKWKEFKSDNDAEEVINWLASRRNHYSNRLVLMADSHEDFRKKADMYLEKQSHEEIIEGTTPTKNEDRKICFVFPGNGQQYWDMGRSLYRDEPVFRKTIDECNRIYSALNGKSFLQSTGVFIQLNPHHKYDKSQIDLVPVGQPANIMFQLAMIELLKHWGIKPDIVVGHSMGELAAAYTAGALTLEEVIVIQYHRSYQQAKMDGSGGMAAIRAGEEEALKLCKKYKDLHVACINSHESTTVAGSPADVAKICKEHPTTAKKLNIHCAYHSPHLMPLEKDFLASIEEALTLNKAPHLCEMYSTVLGTKLTRKDILDSDHWWNNIYKQVRFYEAITQTVNDYDNLLMVEVAASPTLLGLCRSMAKKEDKTLAGLVSTAARKTDDRIGAMRSLATLYTMGVSINWDNVTGNCQKWMKLPCYAWQTQMFKYEAEESRMRKTDAHDRTLRGLNGEIKLDLMQYFKDHYIRNKLTFPRSAYLEYIIQTQFADEACPALQNITFHPDYLEIPEEIDIGGDKPYRKIINLKKQQILNGAKMTCSCEGVDYAQAVIQNYRPQSQVSVVDVTALKNKGRYVTEEEYYEKMMEIGVEYIDNTRFKLVKEAYVGDGEAMVYLYQTNEKRMRVQTTLLDAAFTLALTSLCKTRTLYHPMKINSLRMNVPAVPRCEDLIAYAKLVSVDSTKIVADVMLCDMMGNAMVEIEGFEAENVTSVETANVDLKSCIYTKEWQPRDSCLPNPDEFMRDFARPENLEKLYPLDMACIEKAEKFGKLISEMSATYARNAIEKTPKSEFNPKMVRYGDRLKQMAKSMPTKMKMDDIPKHMGKVIKACPEYKLEMEMMRRMGNILPETLKDPKPGLAELFQEDMMGAYFIDSITTKIYYKMIADSVKKAVAEAKKHKKMVRILEVGGRLGGLSKYILEALEDDVHDKSVEYTFTDINVAFFNLIQEKLSAFPEVRYQQLDVERDIICQHFTPNSYDIIVCLDTLHCTENTVHSTSHLRDLLCRDGWLIVMESTNNNNTPDIIFGAFELCWIYEDMRKDRCWMNQAGWSDVLTQAGFSDVAAVSSPNEFYHSLIVGRKTNMDLFYEQFQEQEQEESMETDDKPMNLIVHLNDLELATAVKKYLTKSTKIVDTTKFKNMHNTLSNYKGPLNMVFLWNPNDKNLEQTTSIIQQCKQLGERPNSKLWVVTQNRNNDSKCLDTAMVTGYLRVAINEVTNMSVHLVQLEHCSYDTMAENLAQALEDSTHTDREVTVKDSDIVIPRVLRYQMNSKKDSENNAWVLRRTTGKNCYDRTIDFHEKKIGNLKTNEVHILVKSVPIKRADAEGKNSDLGLECAGVVNAVGSGVKNLVPGDKVIAFTEGSLASEVVVDADLTFKMPKNLSTDAAAASSMAYSAAYLALTDRAALQPGETVLVHAACSAIGSAVLNLAKYKGANVICTASTEEKRLYLRRQCGITHVSDSRSNTFYEDVMRWTNGKGCDVIVNMAEGALMEMSVKCLANGGRFCHIGQHQNIAIPSAKNTSIYSIEMPTLIRESTEKFKNVVREVNGCLENRMIPCIPIIPHDVSDYNEVLEAAKEGKQIGRHVLNIKPAFCPDLVEPSTELFKRDATYLLTGASSGIGLEFAKWMAKHGARHLIITSRKGFTTAQEKATLKELEESGVKVYDVSVDLADETVVRTEFKKLTQNGKPTLKGIFHLAGINKTSYLEDMTSDDIEDLTGAKANGAKILHQVTSEMKMNLDHFVMFSSSKAIWGQPQMSGFSAACNYIDALAEMRRSQGHPALSVQCGWMRGAGMLEDSLRSDHLQQYTKGASLHITEVLSILSVLLPKGNELPPVLAITNEVIIQCSLFILKH